MATILEATVNTYPDVDALMLGVSEFRQPIIGAERCWAALSREYSLDDIATYDHMMSQADTKADHPGGVERTRKEIASDIETLYFIDKLFNKMKPFARTARPGIPLIFVGLSDSLNPVLHRVLPKGSRVQQSFGYTASLTVQSLAPFSTLNEEIPAHLCMTLQDDNVGVISQLCTRSNETAIRAMARNRAWRGCMLRHWICRDVEPSVTFISKASWEDVDSESVYREHAVRICGAEAADELIEGFNVLEDLTVKEESLLAPIGETLRRNGEEDWPAASCTCMRMRDSPTKTTPRTAEDQ